jgi:hypothetical protein
MTIALLGILTRNEGYDRDDAIITYSRWTHSGAKDMGTNTRFLFANITVRGYESRVTKRDALIEAGTKTISLSNGALMRCSPIALLPKNQWTTVMKEDVDLTNPYRQTREVNDIYLHVLRMLLRGADLVMAAEYIAGYTAKDKVIRSVLRSVLNMTLRDVSGKDKGLAVHALWCALHGLFMDAPYNETIRWVITKELRQVKEILILIVLFVVHY